VHDPPARALRAGPRRGGEPEPRRHDEPEARAAPDPEAARRPGSAPPGAGARRRAGDGRAARLRARRGRIMSSLSPVGAPVAAFVLSACVTLPEAPPHVAVPPAPSPPPAMQVCWLEYAHTELPATYALAGGSDRDLWRVTFSGLLVRHPKGDLLVDVGN